MPDLTMFAGIKGRMLELSGNLAYCALKAQVAELTNKNTRLTHELNAKSSLVESLQKALEAMQRMKPATHYEPQPTQTSPLDPLAPESASFKVYESRSELLNITIWDGTDWRNHKLEIGRNRNSGDPSALERIVGEDGKLTSKARIVSMTDHFAQLMEKTIEVEKQVPDSWDVAPGRVKTYVYTAMKNTFSEFCIVIGAHNNNKIHPFAVKNYPDILKQRNICQLLARLGIEHPSEKKQSNKSSKRKAKQEPADIINIDNPNSDSDLEIVLFSTKPTKWIKHEDDDRSEIVQNPGPSMGLVAQAPQKKPVAPVPQKKPAVPADAQVAN
ncbi:hypothetical protein EST38_g7550 [Candolleomyces aberdarensis]|uniref:Uncharacterized protein n=1 Tax=Candolleomyces aberdarensis TaxID=2316362 RepID=A0A4Q2DEV4_9AGAR|nr:hypothetical protein EST38_g7550 [Candolleomyces aberdarensis]